MFVAGAGTNGHVGIASWLFVATAATAGQHAAHFGGKTLLETGEPLKIGELAEATA